jgi:hypothetical protein
MDRATSSVLQVVMLAFWLGGAALFTMGVAPAVFAVLPTRALAGAVVGRVLPAIFYWGMLTGLAVIVWERGAGHGWRWAGRETASLVIIVSCAVAQLIVSPRIEAIRREIGGSLDSLPTDDARRVAFGRLHAISVAWLGIAMLAGIIALLLAARSAANPSK